MMLNVSASSAPISSGDIIDGPGVSIDDPDDGGFTPIGGSGMSIDTFTVDDGGNVRIIGHISPAVKGAQIGYMVTVKGSTSLDMKSIAYLNRYETGNNGTFYISHSINASFSQKTVVFKFASDTKASHSFEYTLSTIPPGIEQVVNNSVLYGKDVYTMNSIYLNAQYVSDSIATGGNVIYFKIGDLWYNLTDEKATSSAYLIPDNAVTYAKIKSLPLRFYYMQGKKVNFKQ